MNTENGNNFKKQSINNMEKAVYKGEMRASDYHIKKMKMNVAENKGVDDRSTYTGDIIPAVRNISNNTAAVIKTYLCSAVDSYSRSYGDKGWGCGYR